jgi:hypothetical protein
MVVSRRGEPPWISQKAATAPPRDAVHGEGDYQAAREYRRDVERFVGSADIERAAREAAPRDEAEAAELEAAEDRKRRGNPRSEKKCERARKFDQVVHGIGVEP